MEHHHFDQCLMILSSQGNQILSNLSPEEYSRVVKVLEEAILSTDLAVYFRKRGAFLSLARSGGYNWAYSDHRELLRGMLMTVCDLAAITKPWDVEKRVAELVSSEFFEQGDIERQTLNITPIVSALEMSYAYSSTVRKKKTCETLQLLYPWTAQYSVLL